MINNNGNHLSIEHGQVVCQGGEVRALQGCMVVIAIVSIQSFIMYFHYLVLFDVFKGLSDHKRLHGFRVSVFFPCVTHCD